jgi:predicted amidohydrolase YtcJ
MNCGISRFPVSIMAGTATITVHPMLQIRLEFSQLGLRFKKWRACLRNGDARSHLLLNIRMNAIAAVLLSAVFVMSTGLAQKQKLAVADLVIRNATIVTIDNDNPRAEAIAIRGDRILAVSTNGEIESCIESGRTIVIDAKGRLVVPGFNDAHAHFGALDPDFMDLRYVTDPKIIARRVAERVRESKPGDLIFGGHWDHELFPDRKWPTKQLLDPVSPRNPVVLSRADGHAVLVNSFVIRNSGITKNTPDPPGGEIQRDAKTGVPTGIFKESAQGLLKYEGVRVRRSPGEEEARSLRGWKDALRMAARLGVTSIQLPPGGDFETYQRLLDEGRLTVRVTIGGALTDDRRQLARYDELRKKYPREGNWIRFGYLKGVMDGTLGSGTALLFQPFSDEPGRTGLPQMSYKELERRVLAADAGGFQIGIHAIGDKANNWILNAYEKTQEANGKRDSRHRSEHAQILTDDDISRFARLGVIASMQPTHCITDKNFAEKRLGRERCAGAYAWRKLLDAGAHVAFGTDYSVEPLDPLEGLCAAVTRKDRKGEPGSGWFPDQILTMGKAIELYTLGSAFAEFTENRKGMLRAGYLADLVVFEKDLFKIPKEEIVKNRVDYTIVGGKVIYQR